MAVTAGARMAHALLERLEREGKLDEALRCEIVGGELVIRGSPRRGGCGQRPLARRSSL